MLTVKISLRIPTIRIINLRVEIVFRGFMLQTNAEKTRNLVSLARYEKWQDNMQPLLFMCSDWHTTALAAETRCKVPPTQNLEILWGLLGLLPPPPSQGSPRGIESIEKVLNFKIGFQDLEKVLHLANKMSLRYWKSMEILNGKDQKCKVIQQTSVNPDSIWPTILSGLGQDPD